jgi:hypothetical protein
VGDALEVRLMPEFAPAPGGGVRLVLDAEEAGLLRRLSQELSGLLRSTETESDPILERLFPSAYEDPLDDQSYRDMVGDDLNDEKVQALEQIADSLQDDAPNEVVLSDDDISVWLAGLTDLRLAIGVRLDVDEKRMTADVDPADPQAPAMVALHWLGWLQEGILSSVQPR